MRVTMTSARSWVSAAVSTAILSRC
jgi:hypothetical protein